MFSEKEVLEIAIRMEKNGEQEYLKAMQTVDSPVLVDALEWMAAEEREHAEFFSTLLEALETRDRSHFGQELDAAFLKDLIGGSSLSLKTVDFSQVSDQAELMEIFIGFEEDSILFYEMITPMIEDRDTRDRVARIIAEERAHIKTLRELVHV